MKKIVLTIVCLTFILSAGAQDRKIQFHENEPWAEVVKAAQQKNQLIFMDCYTTWCGPCKMLDKNVFSNNDIADFYNATFTNAKYDMEKGEGIDLLKKYGVSAFPTLLYIDPNTLEVVHRFAGAGDVEYVLAQGKLAMDPENNLSGLKTKFEAGKANPEILNEYLEVLTRAGMSQEKSDLTIEYLDRLSLEQLLEADNWELLRRNVHDILSTPMQKVLANKDAFVSAFGEEQVEEKINVALMVSSRKFYPQRQVEPVDNFDKETFDTLVKLSADLGTPMATSVLAQLTAAGYAQNREYNQLIDYMYEAVEKKMVDDRSNTVFLLVNLTKVSQSDDEAVRGRALKFVDDFIASTEEPYTKSSFYQMKSAMLKQFGDEVGSEAARNTAMEIAKDARERGLSPRMM